MLKYSILLYILLIFYGCSLSKETVKEDKIAKDMTKSMFKDSNDSLNNALNQFIDGSIAEAKGNYSDAINYYLNVLKLDPKPGVYYSIAKNYLSLNKLSQALFYAKKAVELDSEVIDYYDLLSDIYSNARQADSASMALSKIIEMDSTDVSAYYRLARLFESNRPLEAISIYEKITDIVGPDWNVLMRVAELQANMKNFTAAAASIKTLLTIDPSNTSLKKILTEYYQQAKMYDDALQAINDVLATNPDDIDAHNIKGQIYLEENKWDSASSEFSYILNQKSVPLELKLRIGASYFEQSLKDSTLLPLAKKFFKSIDKDTANWQVKMYLGAVALSEKNDSDAIEEFKAATVLASWNVEAWVRLGGLYFDNRKYEEAVKVLKEAIKSFPEDFRVNLILGLSLSQLNRNDEAKINLKKAVELNPTDISALSAYGYTLSQLKENDEAVIYLKKALIISPEDVNLLGTLGLIYDGEKNWAECDSVYEKALKIDSSNALINNNYAYSLSERGIKLEKALAMAKIAIKAEPNNSAYLDTIGWVYFKMGDFNAARVNVEKALSVGGDKSDILDHLGDILFKSGDKNKAKETWMKAFSLDKNNSELKQKIEKGEI